MAEDEHNHICPACGIEWEHAAAACDFDVGSRCEECLAEQIYSDEEETYDAEGTRIVVLGRSVPGPSDRESTPMELQLMKICGFKSLEEMDQYYCPSAGHGSGKAVISDDRTEESMISTPDSQAVAEASSSAEVGAGSVAFAVRLTDFRTAIKFLLAGRSRETAKLDSVDLNAMGSEVELGTTGSSSAFPAEIRTSGYARLPLQVFERIGRAVRMLLLDSAVVTIKPGEIRFAQLVFSHPEIEVRLIGARIADLPIDASLPDVLALMFRFRPEELEDSGLTSRVLEAQGQATRLIDRAAEILRPLEIEREELSRFVSARISRRNKKKD